MYMYVLYAIYELYRFLILRQNNSKIHDIIIHVSIVNYCFISTLSWKRSLNKLEFVLIFIKL